MKADCLLALTFQALVWTADAPDMSEPIIGCERSCMVCLAYSAAPVQGQALRLEENGRVSVRFYSLRVRRARLIKIDSQLSIGHQQQDDRQSSMQAVKASGLFTQT
ncbi:hypothetical protein MHYP_G00079360 [Metynnis hypsauchen]